MYYRRKIILGLLEEFGGKLNKTDFQKLLFILSKHQKDPSYEFVPYKYGCFSFQSYADIRTMIKYRQIEEEEVTQGEFWIKTDSDEYVPILKKSDRQLIRYLKNKFQDYSTENLVKYTYKKYPFYAINSTIASKILTGKEYSEIEMLRPNKNNRALYTIGYEGISQEEYLKRLIRNDVKVLCDVRRNPKSMKYGFSKNQLKSACLSLNIEYIHLPKLGISSDKRKKLHSQCDYDLLFEEYNGELDNEEKNESIELILELLKMNDRIALTCFEANIDQCHRKHLAAKIYHKQDEFELIHI